MMKAIIFDCFGVLTADTWREFVATLPPEQQDEARGLNHAYDAKYLTKAEFMQQLEDLTGRRPDYIDDRLDEATTKNQQLLGYIAELKQTYKIGLLSNVGTNWVTEHFLTPDEQKLFDAFIFSYEVGMTKPDHRIFKLAAEKLSQPPENCVFIDDIDRYCQAAREVGMQAIVYQDFEQTKSELSKILVDSSMSSQT